MHLSFEEKKERVQHFRPIDDVFFEVLAQDRGVCEEILRVILEDPALTVQKVYVQDSIRSLYGRSVRLDARCTLCTGEQVNIEVQKADDDDHLRRARYNAACITSSVSDPGTKFKDVPTVYEVYISKFDLFGDQKTIYHIDKHIRETDKIVDDGLHEIFVNAKIDDGSDIAELMQCFLQEQVDNKKFPRLSNRVALLKSSEGGVDTMCEVMEKFAKEYAEEYAKEYAAEREDRKIANALIKGKSPEIIAECFEVTLQKVLDIQKGLPAEI